MYRTKEPQKLFLSKNLLVFKKDQRLFFFIKDFIFLAAVGLCCCARAFSSCGEWGLLFVAVRGLLTAVTSLAAEHGL